jgi:hypothetical protein
MSAIFEYVKDIVSTTNRYDFGSNNDDVRKCGLFVFEDEIVNLLINQENKYLNYKNELSIFYINMYEHLINVNESLMENYYSGYKENIINFEDDIDKLCDGFDVADSKKITTKWGLRECKMKKIAEVRIWLLEKNTNLVDKTANQSPVEFVGDKSWDEEYSESFGASNAIQEYTLKIKGDRFKLDIKKNGIWENTENNYSSYVIAIQEISESMLADKMRKHPKIGKELNKVLIMSNYRTEDVIRFSDKIISQKQVLKNKNVDILNLTKSLQYNLEDLEDEIDYIMEVNAVEKFALSIMSNKYKHLAITCESENKEVKHSDFKRSVFESFKLLEQSGVSKSDLQKYIGVKLEKYKCSSDLEEGLDKLNSMVNNFSSESVVKQLNKYNTNVVVKNDNILIAEIFDFYSSKKVGSQSWCISSYESNWDDYVGKDSRQFFIYNFEKDAKKSDSMIGLTLSFDEESKKYIKTAAHYKDDEEIEEDSYILSRYIKSINKNISPKKIKGLKLTKSII